MLIRSTGGSCCATAILYSVVPRLGEASPQLLFLRLAPQSSSSLPWQLGALAAASAMAGDCLSSFIKRRFGLEPSSMTLGLDQVPELLFPAVACSAYLPLGPLDVALIVLVFSVGELATSRLFFAVGLRDRPY